MFIQCRQLACMEVNKWVTFPDLDFWSGNEISRLASLANHAHSHTSHTHKPKFLFWVLSRTFGQNSDFLQVSPKMSEQKAWVQGYTHTFALHTHTHTTYSSEGGQNCSGVLVQAEEEAEEEMAEDLSAGELQEKLKRLESLQELRVCNEDKVTTIDTPPPLLTHTHTTSHSSHTHTHTHSSLLTHTNTGWSHVTFVLKDRIGGMRKRAKMVQDLEEALHTSSEALRAYQGFLEQPLTPLHRPGSQTTGTT